MTIQDLSRYYVSAIHYPSWVDYFDWKSAVKDMGDFFLINNCYRIDKSNIYEVNLVNDRIVVVLNDHRQIFLDIFKAKS